MTDPDKPSQDTGVRGNADMVLSRKFPEVASQIHVVIERLSRLLRDDLGALLEANGGLKLQDWRTMTVLRSGEAMAQKDILNLVLMEQAQVSRALASLTERGLVITQQSSTDKRSWLFSLSDEGREFYDRIHPAALARKKRIDESLSPQQIEQLLTMADTIWATVKGSKPSD